MTIVCSRQWHEDLFDRWICYGDLLGEKNQVKPKK